MSKFEFKGIIATAFTPFNNDDDQTLNLPVIQKYAEHFKGYNFNCVLINGTYGEGMSMTTNERIEVAEAWAQAVKKTQQYLMIHVGGTNLTDVKKLARHAQSIKANALLCLPDLYYKPKTIEELVDYLKEVGEAAPDTPLFYYHSPLATGVTLSIDQLFGKVKNQVPSFAGIKFASACLDDLSRAMRKANDEFQIIVASNHNMPLYIKMGIDTFMPTAININPDLVNEIYNLAFDEFEHAQRVQKRWSDIINAIAASNNGNAAPSMKALSTSMWKINLGPVRKPWRSLETPEGQAEILAFKNIITGMPQS